jgi:hypothetical protein
LAGTAAGCPTTASSAPVTPCSTILADQDEAGYPPNINSEVLPETLGTAFATGNFNRVSIINGTNRRCRPRRSPCSVTADEVRPRIASWAGSADSVCLESGLPGTGD